jgi:L-lysine 6-transaminase
MHPQDLHDFLGQHVCIEKDAPVADLFASKGSWFVDQRTGKKLLDCYSQFASQPLGWNHEGFHRRMWNDPLIKTLLQHNIANSDMLTSVYGDFVQHLRRITPDFKYYFFISGGTLGVENALKAAFDWKAQKLGLEDVQSNRMNVIHLQKAFHGRSGYTLSLTNTGETKTKWYPKWDWTRVPAPAIHFPEDEDMTGRTMQVIDSIEWTLKTNMTAAVIFETIQGEGGDNHFQPLFFQEVRQLCDQYDALFILDEVQTGVGLTGKMWAYQHYGVIPDMICFGKKMQVCGCASTGRIDEVPNNVFKVGGRINSTWGGNLLDMYRASHYIDIILEDGLVGNAATVGDYLLHILQQVPHIDNVRGRGLMIAFDVESTEKRDQLHDRLWENMMVLKSGDKSIRLRPHLTFSKEDADAALTFITEAV